MELTIPADADAFLAAAGWAGAEVVALPGDASFRRYFRVTRDDAASALLMDAPPPREDPRPFVNVARWLDGNGMRAPRIFHADEDRGLVLIEDFGVQRMREHLDAHPQDEVATYTAAVDALADLRALPPGPFPAYSLAEYLREVRLFIEWYCPARGLDIDAAGYEAAWRAVLEPLLPRQTPGVTVLRDYHAENIMLLGSVERQGLLDFQDALIGHPAYDLVSLLQDARREVDADLETRMLIHYASLTGADAEFLDDYAVLGAQRNAKIVGIFVRLWQRDAKPHYLGYIPRVWNLLERDLAHPALAPVAEWFDANIPEDLRAAGGGSFVL